ncbi:transglutaminase [Arsenicitalea aurantiaca]|uniref:Transglutaminase n=1 Tax=Arsenicitalea aurantiaca TaxID=1783274 RepID=A0A433XG62_9HYPH|nr:transglutaminase-like cysteine peptidase [Arsenicitalea aurantiaca]RUT33050.1 transglutaminase [Arsenicitalea aurantiaca]
MQFADFAKALAIAVIALGGLVAPALANSAVAGHPVFIKVSGATSIPVGHLDFCRQHPRDCAAHANPVAAVELTETRWMELLAVNSYFNETIIAMTDEEIYGVAEMWAYPEIYGDCEDFALAKRRALIEAGWPASALLITVVRETNGAGHAVLTVRTDRGDLVLDNQDGMIRVWNETPYQFLKRQSQAHAGQWVDLLDERTTIVAAR